MSRLIDADVLIEAIVNRAGSETVLYNTTEELNAYLEGCAYKQNAIIDMINDLQTAYDVEKVVEELEVQKWEVSDWRDKWRNEIISNCIDIVKRGGIE